MFGLDLYVIREGLETTRFYCCVLCNTVPLLYKFYSVPVTFSLPSDCIIYVKSEQDLDVLLSEKYI
eukprot:CCRYP_007902-RA/>CCRYP_007902-RA protein AED:0.46 eAED:0.46 QI:6/1/0.5/1/0/0/2/0/65